MTITFGAPSVILHLIGIHYLHTFVTETHTLCIFIVVFVAEEFIAIQALPILNFASICTLNQSYLIAKFACDFYFFQGLL